MRTYPHNLANRGTSASVANKMCMTPVVMVAREVYDFHAWLTVWRWGVGIAFSGLVIRIARFLWLW